MLYQRKKLSTGENIGKPAALPLDLVGLTDVSLADLPAAIPLAAPELGYEDQGFIPVAPDPAP